MHRRSTANSHLQPACFFDRDGTLNEDIGYLHNIEDFVWMTGALEAVRLLKNSGFLVFVVTNQSGVGRGYYTEREVCAVHEWMNDELKKLDTKIDEYIYCPHHPNAVLNRYKQECYCRKPQPGMILNLLERWPIDLERSFLIGDAERDILAAKAANIAAFKFDGGNLKRFVEDILDNTD